MQRYTRAADFLYQRFATRLQLFQVRRSPRRISRAVKNDVGRFQFANRPVIRIRKCIDLLRDPQRRFPHSIVRANVAHDCRINRAPGNHDPVIAHVRRIVTLGKTPWHHDKRIIGADEITIFFHRGDFVA